MTDITKNKNQTVCIENVEELKRLCEKHKDTNDGFYSFEEIKEALREITNEQGACNFCINVAPENLSSRYYMFEDVEFKRYSGDGFFVLYRYIDIAKG